MYHLFLFFFLDVYMRIYSRFQIEWKCVLHIRATTTAQLFLFWLDSLLAWQDYGSRCDKPWDRVRTGPNFYRLSFRILNNYVRPLLCSYTRDNTCNVSGIRHNVMKMWLLHENCFYTRKTREIRYTYQSPSGMFSIFGRKQ